MKIYYKLFFILILFLLSVFYYLVQWKNFDINKEFKIESTEKIHEYIKKNSLGKCCKIESMSHIFDVKYIENMPLQSLNPYFPIIYISNNETHVWLHLVRTDAKFQKKYQYFIDASNELYPMYSEGAIFIDQPLWNYTFFQKPLSFWKGHAWAIQINEKNKTITCIGGIEWGWKLSYFAFKPIMIKPSPLAKQEWKKDWEEMYQSVFVAYKDITEF